MKIEAHYGKRYSLEIWEEQQVIASAWSTLKYTFKMLIQSGTQYPILIRLISAIVEQILSLWVGSFNSCCLKLGTAWNLGGWAAPISDLPSPAARTNRTSIGCSLNYTASSGICQQSILLHLRSYSWEDTCHLRVAVGSNKLGSHPRSIDSV